MLKILLYVLVALALGIAIGAGVETLPVEDAMEPGGYGKPG